MMGPIDPVRAKITPKASGMTRSTIALPATASTPKSAQRAENPAEAAGEAKVVSIDAFRKK